MTGATFIALINLVVAGLVAASFLAISTHDSVRVAGRWLSGAYALGMLYYVIEFSIRLVSDSAFMMALSAAVLLSGLTAFNLGLASRYKVRAPLFISVLTIFVGAAVAYWVTDLSRQLFTRMLAFQGPYFVMQMLAAAVVFAGARRKLDFVFSGVLGASALQFLSKPFIAHAVGGWGANPAAYLDSYYAMISQTMATLFALSIALLAMIVLARDILLDATLQSETDLLSGLRNRRGFETQAGPAIERARRLGLPVSVVVCDIDRFKTVNDTFGHAAGDRVLVAFARFLAQTACPEAIPARVGGEEFAILLPGSNLAAARLFAEDARAAFRSMPVEGLPDDRRFTASFGVAELAADESLPDMLRRADVALYDAKRNGRDIVRVSLRVAAGAPARLFR
ncbi:MAG: GGDEF domain-containing protein [Rhizobiaceae bacterium]|nr:GGDEF domain-containing protein [Rhizobiaceae bacterium]